MKNLAVMAFQTVFFYLAFPPVGTVMMIIECTDYRATDVALSLFVPLYGHVVFWTCD